MSKRVAATLVLMIVLSLGVACAGKDATSELAAPPVAKKSGTTTAGESDERAPHASSSRAGGAGDAGGGARSPSDLAVAAPALESGTARQPLPDIPPMPQGGSVPGRVIKNISLEIRIKKDDFQRQFTRAGSLAEQFGGFVTNSQVSETDGRLASGTLTIRVPSDRFEEAVSRLKGLGKVTAEDRSGQDVSKEFIDLEARLKQAEAEEAFFLRLMDEAKGISDMIQVQSQLSGVQLRIEEIQGQLNYLKDQTAFSTISVRVYEPGAAEPGSPRRLEDAWEQAIEGFQSVIGGLIVAVGWLAPFALIALVGLLVLRLRNRPRPPVGTEVPPPVQS